MSPRVTAILVARNGADHLPRTLEALAAQTLPPDALIAVDCASTDATQQLLADAGPTHLVTVGEALSFGDAIATAVRVTAPPTGPGELLWLLAQDSAPEPGALAALVAALETAPSVAVAGPKLVDWEHGHIIRRFGESITTYGASVPIVASELDQGQHDTLNDVLGVSPAGMLVRHQVWESLGGFDPGLPVVDDSLDFSVRARLAGHRVSVAPAAHVAIAGDGVAGPNLGQKGRVRRRRARLIRTAQLHRRLVYAPAGVIVLHWLSLVPLAVVRSLTALLRKQPGVIGGEFAAAFVAAFSGIRTSAARRRLKQNRSLGWAAIAPLRIPPAEMRRRRALAREARIAHARGARDEVGFLITGGAWTLLAAIVVAVIVVSPLLGAGRIGGGGLLPLSTVPELWRNIGYGWRDIGTGFVGAADPFTAVLAILGSLTFWAPSLALTVLWFAAIPLAALGAWFAASRMTERGGLRAVAAVLWMLAPTLLSALAEGRPAGVLVHILLPWLVFSLFVAARSWSASAASALLLAAIVACAPGLAPALVIAWVVVLVTSGRGFFRIIGIPIPAAVLLAPLVWNQGARENWLALLADPGVPQPGQTPSVWQLLLGFPAGGFGGWNPVLADLAVSGVRVDLIVPILLAPLAVLALLGLFFRRSVRASAFSLGLALLGFATAVITTLIVVASTGSHLVPLWAGAGLSLYWLGIVGAVIAALNVIPRFSMLPAVAATALVVIVAGPLALALPLDTAQVHAATDRVLPAFVTAAAEADPRAGTLVIAPQSDGGIRADLQRGSGTTLDDQSTLSSTDPSLDENQRDLARLAGNLASRSGLDAADDLNDRRIRFILLAPVNPDLPADESREAAATERRATSSLDGNPVLVSVGKTNFGTLWRVGTDVADAAPTAIPVGAGGWLGQATLIALLVVFGITVLLSIPTGVGREVQPDADDRSRPDADEQTPPVDDWEEPTGDALTPEAGEDAGEGPDAEARPDPEPDEPAPSPEEPESESESSPEPDAAERHAPPVENRPIPDDEPEHAETGARDA
ncbi:glycosyltransferase [Rathayibacter sp. YIM 133350]|uniref:glycosyltransferase n=1 Tax=Rathayibacter sp. YIM 133350 TaxID=3131992 RepID=UPI00307CE4A2